MNLHDYLRSLRKSWLVIAVITLVGIGGGAAASYLATPRYSATTEVFVSVQTSDNSTSGDLAQGTSFAQQKVYSYVSVVDSAAVLQPVIDKLNLNTTPAELAGHVVAFSPQNTVLIDITVDDENAATAAAIANAVGTSLHDVVVGNLESPVDGGTSLVKVETVQPAVAAVDPFQPNIPLNLALGFVAGLILGMGIAVLRAVLDTSIRGIVDVEHLTDASILGGIGIDPAARRNPLIVSSDPRSPRAESFRSLRTNLQFVDLESSSRVFVVTSSLPGEAKTTTTANLAIAIAETGASVAVIDGDLRAPRLAEYMGLEGAVGLTDVLIGNVKLEDVMQQWGDAKLQVLPAGQIPPNPSELLGSPAMGRTLTALKRKFKYILIDTPPLLPVTDAAVLSKRVDGVLMVVAAGRAKKADLTAALKKIEQVRGKVLGVVVTMLPTKGPDAYGYGQYGAAYGAPAAERRPEKPRKEKASRQKVSGSVGREFVPAVRVAEPRIERVGPAA